MNFQSLYGPWALITGASSGLGEHYARAIAKKGLNLILIARRKERLENLANDLTNKHSIQTHVIALDLCEEHALDKIKESTIDMVHVCTHDKDRFNPFYTRFSDSQRFSTGTTRIPVGNGLSLYKLCKLAPPNGVQFSLLYLYAGCKLL